MGLRKGSAYRKVVRAYTRKSKFKGKSFIKAVPVSKVIKFNTGDTKKIYEFKVELITKDTVQIRHNSIESARQLINRRLGKKLGNFGYHMLITMYPHHVLRENRMLTGAGADRMQTGMQQAFGKPVGIAAQVKEGKTLFVINVMSKDIETAKEALRLGNARLPCRTVIRVTKIQ